MGRSMSIIGSTRHAKVRDRPTITPDATPATAARKKPRITRERLAAMSLTSSPLRSISRPAAATVSGAGAKIGLNSLNTDPLRCEKPSQRMKKPITADTLRSISRRRTRRLRCSAARATEAASSAILLSAIVVIAVTTVGHAFRLTRLLSIS